MTAFAKRFMTVKYFWFCFFVGMAVILALSARTLILHTGIEIGDFAANSLLIQDAKHFNLFIGHYSRVGFNHPGPALLYIHALGEFLFYDCVHWLPSAIAGQLLIVVLYNAFWLTLFATLLRHYTKSIISTIALVAVFMLISSSVAEHGFFTGLWFPHLYYGPFAVLLLALAHIAEGRTDALFSLALSTGVLINGHASFIPITTIMLVITLAYNYVVYHSNLEQRVLSASFLRPNKSKLLLALLLLSLFLLPLLIETIQHFPGPLFDYAQYNKQHVHNHVRAALGFVGQYWGGVLWMFFAAALGIAVYCMGVKNKFALSIRPLLVPLLAATIAFLFYAIRGIDDLNYSYTGYFYYAVPALLACVFLLVLNQRLPANKGLTVIHVLFMVIGFSLTYKNILQFPRYSTYYNNAQIASGYDALNKLKSNERIVVDLLDGSEWPKVVSIANYAKRQQNDLFCIGKNWHILFTKKLQCTSEEQKSEHHFVVGARTKFPAPEKPEPLIDDLGFIVFKRPILQEHHYYTAPETVLLLDGSWSTGDTNYFWSVGTSAKIDFKLPVDFTGQLILDLGSYLPQTRTHQNVRFYLNGKFITATQFSLNHRRKLIKLPITNHGQQTIELELAIKSPIAPSSISASADSRPLGVSLYGLEIQRAKGVIS